LATTTKCGARPCFAGSRKADHLGRQVEELRVHVAEDGGRPFGQAGDLVEQAVVVDEGEAPVVAGGAGGLEDAQLAVGDVEEDVLALQLVAVVGEVLHREGLAGAEEAVAFGGVAGGDAVDLERDHGAVEQGDDPLQRADPAQRPGAPAHRLGPGEGADDLVDHLGDQVGGGAALAADHGEQDAVPLGELVAGQAGLAQEAVQRLFRGVGAGALELLLAVRRGGGQTLDHEGQAARAGEGGEGVIRQAGGLEAVGGHPLEIARGAGLHARGDFFGEEFEEELGHYRTSYRGAPFPLEGGRVGDGGGTVAATICSTTAMRSSRTCFSGKRMTR
jgi:hypothetical protein